MTSSIPGRLRRRLAAPAAALALAVGAASALVVASAGAAEAGSSSSQYGTLSAADTVLPAANQCGTYSYSYDLTPPPGNWAVEFFVVDPRGNTISSWAALNRYSAGGTRGSTSYSLCSNNTRAGVFTISAKISTDDGTGKISDYQMAPATFTLSEPTTTPATAQAKQRTEAKKAQAKKAKAKKKAKQKRKQQKRQGRSTRR